jgi:predicted negative regulator of RcsB-dependent stress response
MATSLDLQEQEQLDSLKAFWQRWGNLLTWGVIAVLAGFAAWNGWNWYQRDQAVKAAALFDELDRAVLTSDAERSGRIFGDLRERFPRTQWAAHGGLLVARLHAASDRPADAVAALQWVVDKADDTGLRSVAVLRLAGIHLDAGRHDEALRTLDMPLAEGFEALRDDRRGDVLLAKGQAGPAAEAYRAALNSMPSSVEYRRVVEAKLTALGEAPPAPPDESGAGLGAPARS